MSAASTSSAAVPTPPPSFDDANVFSRYTFWWLNGLLTLGYKRALQIDDIPSLPRDEKSQILADQFEAIIDSLYRNYLPGKRSASSASSTSTPPPSFFTAVLRLIGWKYAFALTFSFISETLAFAGPILVGYLTEFLDDDNTEPTWHGWLYTALLFVLPTIASLARNAYYINAWRVTVRLRAAILTSVFRKSIRLTPAARRIVSDGEILTLMSVDVTKISEFFPLATTILTGPCSIIACFVLIWLQVGVSTLAGVAVIALLMPTNIWLGRSSGVYRRFESAQTDLRMRYIKESTTHAKTIKYYGWAESFQNRITLVRQKEIAIRRKAATLEAISNSILILQPVLISLATFLTFAGLGHELTATNVFTSLALFNVMRFQLANFPLVLAGLFECRVSLTRLLRLLLREELATDERDYIAEPLPKKGEPIARIDNATFNWDMGEEGTVPAATSGGKAAGPKATGTDSNFRLASINLTISRGSFVSVVGAVGSGKSSLIAALLGEVKRASGPRVFLRGRIAYVPQTAWILNATLKDNILFGLPLDPALYERVIDVCCLRADLNQLPGGDQTQIGDRGVNLSGGQKQRCSIARAVYSILNGQSDLLLIDDPLSAVDAHVSKALFENVLSRTGILGRLGVTIVLAMNQLHFLPYTDHVVVMKGGKIAQQGTFDKLMQQGEGELAVLMNSYGFEQDKKKEEEEKQVEELEKQLKKKTSSAASAVGTAQPSAVAATTKEVGSTGPAVTPAVASTTLATTASPASDAVTTKKPASASSQQAESRVEGSVSGKIYAAYIRACGGWWIFNALVFLFSIHQVFRVTSDFWLAAWSNQDWDNPSHSLAYWMGYFALFGGIVTIASLIRSMLFAHKSLTGSYQLHQQMLESIFRSPASFFDTTPVGRIINRFAADIDKLDHMIARTLEGWAGCIFFVGGTIVAICVVYPFFVFPLLVIIAIYYRVQQYYVASSRELQRLDNISKSPIFSHFGESLSGSASIRAFGSASRSYRINEQFIDANHRNVIVYQSTLCWLGVRIELISTLLMTVSAIFAVASRGSVNASLVGLSIVYSITITSFLNFAVRLGSIVEGFMSSVERIDEYSALPSEAAPYIPEKDPPTSWPSKGAITFDKCVLRYRPELEDVLKGISFTIKGGEKVGIIGRTGSGKSSMMVALFRLVELRSGAINLDGVDIGSIGLETLRTRITLIPQDPVVFAGTVRYNLDPFATQPDSKLWAVLKLVNLENKIRSMDGALDYVLSESESLSVGERQLLCVARALLRQTRILVLDEATASVDIESDNLIQKVISTQFQSSTVLAIAHRLSTIMDYDRIIVMDGGLVAEYGVPHELLQNPLSSLTSLVDATGPASATHLKYIAKLAYQNIKAGKSAHVDAAQKLAAQQAEAGILPGEGNEFDTAIEASCVRFHEVPEGED